MGIQDLSYNQLQAIKARGTTYKPFTVKDSGLAPAVVKRLNTQMTTAKKAQLHAGAAKALTGFMSMREMVATERMMKTADIPIERVKHGKVIPIVKQTGIILEVQRKILTGGQKAAGKTVINLADESAHAALMDMKVAGLMDDIAELKANPIIEYRDPPKVEGFGFKLPDWLKLPDFGGKLAAIGAGVGVVIVIIVGVIAFAFLKRK